MLVTGYANGGEAKWKEFLGKVYHKPGDDLSQKIDWKAAARYGKLNYGISSELADADQRPIWYQAATISAIASRGRLERPRDLDSRGAPT